MTTLGDQSPCCLDAQILRVIGQAVVVCDQHGRVLQWNAAAAELYGVTASEAVGQAIDAAFRDRTSPFHRDVDVGGTVSGVVQLSRRDGQELQVFASTTAASPPGHDAPILISVATDVTERRAADQAMRLLSSIVETSRDAVLAKTLDGVITAWNPAAEVLYGYSTAEAIGMNVVQLVPPQRRHELEAIFADLRRGTPVDRLETKRVRKDGTEIDVSVTVSPLLDDQGQPMGASVIVRDITRDRQLEQQIADAQRLDAVGRLAGGIAHDFNNVLTAVLGYAELLHSERSDAEMCELALQGIRNVVDGASSLTRQLLAYSRRQLLNPKPVSVNDAVTTAMSLLERTIGEDIEVEARLCDEEPVVHIDETQLQQVLVNLVLNARDAMQDGGCLRIETSVDPSTGEMQLRVADTGEGMDEEVRRRCFEPFFTTKASGGTGLGLSTVHGIVNQSGGSIEVQSRPGAGCAFTISFPALADPALPRPAPTPTPGTRSTWGTERILVVEDDPRVRAVVVSALTSRGYSVLEAPDGSAALELFEDVAGAIDLLITDTVMPRLGGPGLVQELRRRGHRPRVLYISGYTSPGLAVHDPTIRQSLLLKPFRSDELAERARAVLDEG